MKDKVQQMDRGLREEGAAYKAGCLGQEKGPETIRLSKRLDAVAGMVTEGNIVCDVGCDHGFVSIYLIRKAISPRVFAMDVNSGPLQAAREHILDYGLQDYIETRLSDGVEALKGGEADSLICAGMGGRLVIRILEEGKRKIRSMKEVILQPQSEIRSVREYLRKEGYLIVDENMILEDEKYYPVIKAEPVEICPVGGQGNEAVTEWGGQGDKPAGEAGNRQGKDAPSMVVRQRIEDKYGPVLLAKKNPVLEMFLHREYELCMEIMEKLRKNGKDKRQGEMAERIRDIEEGLSYFALS